MTPSAKRVREYLNARAEMFGHGPSSDNIATIRSRDKNWSLAAADLEAMIAQHTEMVDVLKIIAETAADLKIIAETAADELAAHEASLKQTPGTLLPGHPDYLGE